MLRAIRFRHLTMSLTQKPALTLAAAQRILAAAAAEADANRWLRSLPSLTTAVTFFVGSAATTPRSAASTRPLPRRCALTFKRPTKAWQDAAAEGRCAILGLPGVVPFEGGLPLVSDGMIVGAIGVSGVRAAQDGQIAQAGANAIV